VLAQYNDLRSCIYTNDCELEAFRELIVDAVLATDIADKELGTLRKNRWEQAFIQTPSERACQIDQERKATIVLEHIIQASNVCISSRLFEE
jgi:hypothetical protein